MSCSARRSSAHGSAERLSYKYEIVKRLEAPDLRKRIIKPLWAAELHVAENRPGVKKSGKHIFIPRYRYRY